MTKQYSQQNKVFFYTVMIILAGLGLWLVSGYLDVIVFSLVMVVILKPLYNLFERWLRGRTGLATVATLIAMVLILLIPSFLALRVVGNQISSITDSVVSSQPSGPLTLESFQEQVNELIATVPYASQLELTDEQIAEFRSALLTGATWLGKAVVNLGMSIPNLLAKLFVFLAIVGVLLPNYNQFVQRLLKLSPLDDEVDRIFLGKIKSMVWAMFVGIVVIALVQGLITGLFFWLGDVPYTPLWTLIAVIASTLPLGASLIAIPIAVFQLVVGQPVSALIILGGYILIVSNIDSLLRPKLVPKEAYLDAALVLVAALGGYDLFGFFGVIYGPVLMVLVITVIEVYGKYYAAAPESAAPIDCDTGVAQVLDDGAPMEKSSP